MIKNPPEISDSEKVYDSYAKDRCIYHNLGLEDFEQTWEMLNIMVGISKTDYQVEDLDYTEVEETPNDGEESSY